MRSRAVQRFEEFLSREIMIEYKACLYFACILFFYFAWLLWRGSFLAQILFMFEMILAAYAAGYVQVCLFHNSDEAERLEKADVAGILFCTLLYGGTSWCLAWFDRSPAATALFLAYMLFVHYCVYLLNKVKRAGDTRNLNRMLNEFKGGGGKEKTQERNGQEKGPTQALKRGDEDK